MLKRSGILAAVVLSITALGLSQSAQATDANPYLCSEGGIGESYCEITSRLDPPRFCSVSCSSSYYACCHDYTGDEPRCECIGY